MIQAVKKGTLQCQPLITNGCNANDKELHGWKSAPRLWGGGGKKGACGPAGDGGAEAGRGTSFSQQLKLTSCIFRHRDSSGNSYRVGGGAQMPHTCQSLSAVRFSRQDWTLLPWHWATLGSTSPPACGQLAGQKQDSGEFPAWSEKEQCAIPGRSQRVAVGQLLQQQVTRRRGRWRLWRPPAAQSQQRGGAAENRRTLKNDITRSDEDLISFQ